MEPPAKPLAKLAPKAVKPRAKPSTKSAAKPGVQVAAKPAAGEPIPVAHVEHVQLSRVKILPPEKVAHRARLSVKLNMYPNRQFLAHFVVHMPLYLHVLFCVVCPLHSNGGGGAREPSLGVCSLVGARIPLRTGIAYARGRWGTKVQISKGVARLCLCLWLLTCAPLPPPAHAPKFSGATVRFACHDPMPWVCGMLLFREKGVEAKKTFVYPPPPRVRRMPCPTNTSVRTVFFEDLISYGLNYVQGLRIEVSG